MSQSTAQKGWSGLWTLVYIANLPLPFVLGGMVTDRGGWIGMALGIVVLWTIGLAICAWPGRLRYALVFGGMGVALTQFVFVLHFYARAIALSAWAKVAGNGVALDDSLSDLGRFAITLTTGQPLMVLALAIGWVGCWLFGLWPTAIGACPDDSEP